MLRRKGVVIGMFLECFIDEQNHQDIAAASVRQYIVVTE